MKRLFTVICLFIWMPTPAMGGWFGPSNYEECILKNMKGVASDKAAMVIMRVCRKKFPPVKSKLRSSSLPKMNEQTKQYLINSGKAIVEERLSRSNLPNPERFAQDLTQDDYIRFGLEGYSKP